MSWCAEHECPTNVCVALRHEHDTAGWYPPECEKPEPKQTSMDVKVKYQRTTQNYVYYENEDMDFRGADIKAKLWIPKKEIETNVPGVYPEYITLRVLGE